MSTDDFDDLDALRLPQNYQAIAATEKLITVVPVRKPDRQWFVRVHPDASMVMDIVMLELTEERETFLVKPELIPALPEGDARPARIFTATNRNGGVFLWPVKLPAPDGRTNTWNESAMSAAEEARRSWVKVVGNQALGCYEVHRAAAEIPEPEWPDKSFKELLELAFKDRFINTPDHIVLQRLRGEI